MAITLGMAVYDDFQGLWFTIQIQRAMLLHNPAALNDLRIVVVDSAPKSKMGKRTGNWVQAKIPTAKYIPYTGTPGTSKPRDLVFEHAETDIVICCDSHIILVPGAIDAIQQYLEDPDHHNHLVTGPLVFDPMDSIATHFNDVWEAGMHGQWANAWRAPDGQVVEAVNSSGKCVVQSIMDRQPVDTVEQWEGHQRTLVQRGYKIIGMSAHDDPIEIPAQGLGMFACRKEFWPKFCDAETATLKGFGGEEHNVHELVRQRGGKCVCLPAARWVHLFRDPSEKPPYPATPFNKIRNYVLWHRRLGKPLDLVYDHFVGSKDRKNRMSERQWAEMMKDPIAAAAPIATQSVLPQPPAGSVTADDVLGWLRGQKRDLDQHLDRFKAIAERSESLAEITKRRESTVAFAAGKTTLHTFTAEPDFLDDFALAWGLNLTPLPHPYAATEQYKQVIDALKMPNVDTLYLDTLHDGRQLALELERFSPSVNKWIVLRGTGMWANAGEVRNSPGLQTAIQAFVDIHSDWEEVYFTDAQSGITVLSRNGERPVGAGPGGELKRVLNTLGINPRAGCGCEALAREMNDLGPDGCEQGFDRLVATIEDNKERWGWNIASAAKAAAKAVVSGLALQIDLTNPVASCVRLAIKRSRKSIDQSKPRFFLYGP